MNELVARDGYWLTQNIEIDESMRTFCKRVIGVRATTEYWQEWSNEQKEQWESKYPQPEPIEPPVEESTEL